MHITREMQWGCLAGGGAAIQKRPLFLSLLCHMLFERSFSVSGPDPQEDNTKESA